MSEPPDTPDPVPMWRRYLRFWRPDVEADVADEIEFHLAELIEEYRNAGHPPEEARALALRRFGETRRIARAMRRLAQQREQTMRRHEWLDSLGRDIRFALRQLARRPGFTAVVLATLALGIGANTAIFSAVNTVLLRPLGATNLDRVVFLHDNIPALPLFNTALDPSETLELTRRTETFEAVGGAATRNPVLTEMGEPRRLASARTLGRFFDVFGATPYLGRLYRPEESEGGGHRVALLAYDFWRELGADSGLVGRTLRLNAESFEIVGVMGPDFRYPRGVQLWSPFPITDETRVNRGRLYVTTVARVRPGIGNEQLRARLDAFTLATHPGNQLSDFYMTSRDFVSELAGELRPALLVLLGAVGLVLLIACANVASLQLVRTTGRSRELAVRAALGAGRRAIVRQLLVENLVLALGGGLLGLAAGWGILEVLAWRGAAQLPALGHVGFDRAVLGFAALATVASGVLFGLAPAWRGARTDPHRGLKEGSRRAVSVRRSRFLQGSVVVQVALTLVLLLGSSLMIRTLGRLLAEEPGFAAERVHTFRLTVPSPIQQPELTALYDELLGRLRRTAGLEAVGVISELPFSGSNDSSPFSIRGRAADSTGPALHANLHTVGGDYFAAMGIPVLRGRGFTEADRKATLWVAVIDEQLAKQYFPNEDPIGRVINQGPDATIIGVVGTVSQGMLGEPKKATVYYPYSQHDWYANMYLTVRTALPMAAVYPVVRRVIAEVNPRVPVFEAATMAERVDASLAPRRLAMSVLVGLAAVSLALAVLGLYGIISYAVSQRAPEFGIRLALGARPAQVRGMVVREGLVLGVAGIGVGLAAGFIAARGLTALLFGVSARDAASYLGAAAILAIVAGLASYLPARRATRVNPLETLKAE